MREQKIEIEREGCYEVDHVDRSAKERQSTRTDGKSYEQFEREPAVADALDVEERVVGDRASLVE